MCVCVCVCISQMCLPTEQTDTRTAPGAAGFLAPTKEQGTSEKWLPAQVEQDTGKLGRKHLVTAAKRAGALLWYTAGFRSQSKEASTVQRWEMFTSLKEKRMDSELKHIKYI